MWCVNLILCMGVCVRIICEHECVCVCVYVCKCVRVCELGVARGNTQSLGQSAR